MKPTTFTLKAGRKVAHVSSRTFHKSAHFMDRVERKLGKMAANSSLGDLSGKKGISVDDYIAKMNQILVPIQPALPKLRKPAVNLVLNSIHNAAFTAGPATATMIAAGFATKMGMPLRIVCADRGGKSAGLKDFFLANGITPPEGEVDVLDLSGRRVDYYGYFDLHPEDLIITTAWWTAHLLKEFETKHKQVYLIQDYEPTFYKNGDLKLWAEQSYDEGRYVPLVNSRVLFDHLVLHGHEFVGEQGIWFDPAVPKESFYPAELTQLEAKPKRKLFFYARPNVDRNMFFTGLQAMEIAFSRNLLKPEEWEVVLAGQDQYPSLKLADVQLTNLGKMPFDEYASFARTVDIALSLMMAPHPSYAPLEMAASGAMVVTNRYENKTDLSNFSENIVVTELDKEALAKALHEVSLISPKERLERTSRNKQKQSWPEVIGPAVDAVIKKL